MQFTRKAMLAIDVSRPHLQESLHVVRRMEFLNHAELHLVFVFQTMSMNLGFGEFPYVYPVPADQVAIQQSTEALIADLGRNCFGPDFKGTLIPRCLFGDDPKYRMTEFINEKGVDLVVMWARQKRGMFESSFSNYVSKNTNANVLVLKQPS